MKNKYLLFALVIFFSHRIFASPVQNKIYLELGKTHDIYADPSAKVRVEKKAILTVIDLGNKIRVLSKAVGTSTLLIGQRIYNIHVVRQMNFKYKTQFEKLTKSMLGPSVNPNLHPITIEGKIYRADDWRKIANLARSNEVDLQMHASIDKSVAQEIEQEIRNQLLQNGLPLPQFNFNNASKATYAKKFESLKEELYQIFSPYGVQLTFQTNLLKIEPLIRIQVVVAEVSRQLQNKIGISWPSTLTAQVSPKLRGPNPIEVTLQAIEDEGFGQILASPTLMAKSGGEAEFLAGGEIPIRLSNNKRLEVTWKRHGIFLKMNPQTDLNNQIKMSLTVEVSMLDGATIDGLPAIKTNKISSQFDLAKAETIVLSGLVRNDWTRSSSGLPGFKDIPIFGSLFSSRSFLEAKSELVIFLTPQVIQQ